MESVAPANSFYHRDSVLSGLRPYGQLEKEPGTAVADLYYIVTTNHYENAPAYADTRSYTQCMDTAVTSRKTRDRVLRETHPLLPAGHGC